MNVLFCVEFSVLLAVLGNRVLQQDYYGPVVYSWDVADAPLQYVNFTQTSWKGGPKPLNPKP